MENQTPPGELAPVRWATWLFRAGCAALFAALAWAMQSLPAESGGLAGPAFDHLPQSGVTNPVTAVLLNYRSYDTLLEIAVLLAAVIGAWTVARADAPLGGIPRGPVLQSAVRILVPLIVLVGGHYLWAGSSAPGGAFQAGALWGGAGVLLLLASGPARRLPAVGIVRIGFAAGLAVFAGTGGLVMAGGYRFLEYPVDSAATLILVIETAAAISIGLTLAALFLGGRPTTAPTLPAGSDPS